MIGSQTDAARALAGDLDVLSHDGTTRRVYIVNNVVYKVEYGIDGEGCNSLEYATTQSIADILPDGIRVPETALYIVDGIDVIAMQYIEGQAIAECFCLDTEECDEFCMPADILAKVSPYMDDTGGFNAIVTDTGDIYLIDPA